MRACRGRPAATAGARSSVTGAATRTLGGRRSPGSVGGLLRVAPRRQPELRNKCKSRPRGNTNLCHARSSAMAEQPPAVVGGHGLREQRARPHHAAWSQHSRLPR
jgi:hypothetical protein